MLKKFLSIAIVFAMLMSIVPCVNIVHAETVEIGTCGADGDNLTWILDSEGTLTISGTGEMEHYYNTIPNTPWYSLKNNIKSVVINNGVTSIGSNAFANANNCKKIIITSKKLEKVGKNAFKNISESAKIVVPSNKWKEYKKLLKGKGQSKKVKIVK